MRIRETKDAEYAKEVKQKIRENDGYCPCAVSKTPDTKCMCRDFREQENGMCYCGLYIKEAD